MEPRITLIILAVENVSRSTKFYKDLGFPLKEEGQQSSFFTLGNIQLGVLNKKYLEEDANISIKTNDYYPSNLTYMTRSEKEVDEIIKKAEAVGAKIVRNPKLVEWGAYSAFFADPDNHLWEIVYHKDWI